MGGRLGGWFLWFVGLGLVGLLHVGICFLWVYGGWNTFDIFLCNIVLYVICACLSGLEESHPSGDSDLLLLALPG